MEEVCKCGWMDLSTKGTGRMIGQTAEVVSSMLMVMFMTEIGKMIKHMAMANIST